MPANRATPQVPDDDDRYRILFENSPLPTWVYDLETLAFLAANVAAVCLYGYSSEEFLRMTLGDIRLAEDDALLIEAVSKVRVGETTKEVPRRHRKKNGEWIDVLMHGQRLMFAGRRAESVTISDITDRNRAAETMPRRHDELTVLNRIGLVCLQAKSEDDVFRRTTELTAQNVTAQKNAELELQQSEARLRTLFESLDNVAIQAYESDGTISFWNRASERLYGHSAADALGKDVVELLYAEPQREQERRIMAEALRSGVLPSAYEVEMVRNDGRPVWVCASRICHPRVGKEPEFVCFDVDISERKRTEQTLALRQAELLHASRLSVVGQMVAALSHEVAQPLTAIGNFAAASAALLESSPAGPWETLKDYTQAILSQNQRCAAILQRLRDFSRRAAPRRIACYLNQLLGESVDMFGNELRRHNLQVQFDFENPSPRVCVDRIQIQQVVVNLLANARDSSRGQKGDRQSITIRSQTASDSVIFEVEDRGSGLTPEISNRLFEPFFTTKPNGTGIGLSICRTIIRGTWWHDRGADQ